MVRVKHRYLLVNLLYPEGPLPYSGSSSSSGSNNTTIGGQPSLVSQLSQTLPVGQTPSAAPPDIVQFHRPTPAHITGQHVHRAIREQLALLYGDYGVGINASSLTVKYFSPATSTFIVRCPRAHYRLVWAALSTLSSFPAQTGGGNNVGRAGKVGGGGGRRSNSGPFGGSGGQASSSAVPPFVLRVVRVSGTIRKAEEEAIRRAREDILNAQRQVLAAASNGGSADALAAFWADSGKDKDVARGIVDDDQDDSMADSDEEEQ